MIPSPHDAAHLPYLLCGDALGRSLENDQQRHTFTPVFDGQSTMSIGAIAVGPSDERVLWVGTGEASNVRLSMPGTLPAPAATRLRQ